MMSPNNPNGFSSKSTTRWWSTTSRLGARRMPDPRPPWDERVLEFHETECPIWTASVD